jgi:carbamoyltransferase
MRTGQQQHLSTEDLEALLRKSAVNPVSPPWRMPMLSAISTSYNSLLASKQRAVYPASSELPLTFNTSMDLLGQSETPELWRRLKQEANVPEGTVLGVSLSHDATLAATKEGAVLVVLELERLFAIRYYFVPDEQAELVTQQALATLLASSQLPTSHVFTAAVICNEFATPSFTRDGRHDGLMISFVSQLPAVTIMYADHHHAHAALGFYDSPFRRAFILSYDGGGSDGHMNTFLGSRESDSVQIVKRMHSGVPWFLGSLYVAVSSLISEITDNRQMELALPGKTMALESLGRPRIDFVLAIKGYARQVHLQWQTAFDHGRLAEGVSKYSPAVNQILLGMVESEDALERKQNGRDLAASLQRAFEELVVEALDSMLPPDRSQYDGLVLTGGCALNVKVNTIIAGRYRMPVHVPPAPGDDGLPLGAAWLLCPPLETQLIAFAGPLVADLGDLAMYVKKYNASYAGLNITATRLGSGEVLGVIRQRTEFGPRALGHRSLLAVPGAGGSSGGQPSGMKAKLNRIKHRQAYRPVAPVMTAEFARELFGNEFRSPYMSFAPRLDINLLAKARIGLLNQNEAAWQLWRDDVTHLDQTARVQTVEAAHDRWLWLLLNNVFQLLGIPPCLMNTSLNIKGKPIVNSIADGMELLYFENPDCLLSGLLVDDWHFECSTGNTRH